MSVSIQQKMEAVYAFLFIAAFSGVWIHGSQAADPAAPAAHNASYYKDLQNVAALNVTIRSAALESASRDNYALLCLVPSEDSRGNECHPQHCRTDQIGDLTAKPEWNYQCVISVPTADVWLFYSLVIDGGDRELGTKKENLATLLSTLAHVDAEHGSATLDFSGQIKTAHLNFHVDFIFRP